MEDNNNTIRLIIRAKNNLLLSKRESLGFTQLEMAEYCGVNLTAYACAERLDYDGNSATEGNLRKIADTVEINFETLFPQWASLVGKALNSPENYILLDDDFAKMKMIPSASYDSPKLLKEDFTKQLEVSFKESLNRLEATVIRLYFGIGEDKSLSLEEIGEKLNRSRERIRQIKEKALRRLRFGLSSKLLKEYLGEHFEEYETEGEQNNGRD